MKNVELESLSLINFKGIKELTIVFNWLTSIFGANGLGKTTIFDAFTWLLFGKDSTGSKDFNIKTLDVNNVHIPKIDHEVIGVLKIDGVPSTFRRVYKEKWTKKKGSETTEFTGHETLYFINDAPYQAGEYQAAINEIIDEDLFKLITSPFYFNSLKWDKRREVLSRIAGNVTDFEISQLKPAFMELVALITPGKTFEKFKSEISAKKKIVKEELEKIPTRISEVQRGMIDEQDYEQITAEISGLELQLKDVDRAIVDKSIIPQNILDEQLNDQKKINELIQKRSQLEFNHSQTVQKAENDKRTRVSVLENKVKNFGNDYSMASERIEYLTREIDTNTVRKNTLLADWHTENAKAIVFSDDEFICPACNRAFESENIEERKAEMQAHFNTDKLQKLESMTKQGQGYANVIKIMKEELAEKTVLMTTLYRDLTSAKLSLKLEQDTVVIAEPIPTSVLKEIHDEIVAIQSKPKPTPTDTRELQEIKSGIINSISLYKAKLALKDVNEKAQRRITELNEEDKKLSQQLADLEKQEFVILDFEKAKIDRIEETVNSLFSYVQFKMFSKNINGGIEPCCDTLVNGVPWADLNNAAKVNGGLDIIKTLCNHYNVTAPVFTDNSESVNQLIPMDSQLVRLVVTMDPELRVA